MRRSLLVLLMSALSLCLVAQNAPSAEPLMQADRDFNKATQERKVEGWMQFMADNVVMDRDKPVVGKDAVKAHISPQWSDPNFKLTWEPKRGEMFRDGSMGYTTGRWTRATVKDGKPVTRHGNYLTVWQKQADGSFKVIWDGGAADPMPKK